MKFIEKYPIDELVPADYNPRSIRDDAFLKLQDSISTFGVIIPLIVNEDKTLIAGHQRTKAIKEVGIEKVPIYLNKFKIPVSDEIIFNLVHNRVETSHTDVEILDENIPEAKFYTIPPEKINIKKRGKSAFISELSTLLRKYGEYDSIVLDYNNNIVANVDYAYACKLLGLPVLAYKLPQGLEQIWKVFMSIDYGEYNFSKLGLKSYNQTFLQPTARSETNKCISSALWKNLVLTNITKKDSIFDFGAGKLRYVKVLREQGYNTFGYEPFYRIKGTNNLSINKTVKMIKLIEHQVKNHGLFDIGVCDSVINATINPEYEDAVLTACNALLKPEGRMFIATRNSEEFENIEDKEIVRNPQLNRLAYRDKDNFTVRFNKGEFLVLNLHTEESFRKLLKKYFKEVVGVNKRINNIMVECYGPKKLSQEHYARCLEMEFNMEYPGGVHHNQHKGLVEELLRLNSEK